jgi:hypothetical protein
MWSAPLRFSAQTVLTASLGIGAGLGLSSCGYFLLLMSGAGRWTVVGVEAGLVVAVVAFVWFGKAREWPTEERTDNPGIAILGPFVLAFAMAAGAFALLASINREGFWDAWSIWNLHARFLFRGGPEFWRNAFSPHIPWAHPDYPLLLSGAIALCWTIAGAESALGPQLIAGLFGLAILGVLTGVIAILRGWVQALLAGTLLLGTFFFVQTAASQYADVPVSFYVLATLALFALQDRSPSDLRFTALAGAMAALTAWTKNEGLLFVAVALIARAVAVYRYRGARELLRQIPAALVGALPVLALVAVFKLRYAPANDLMSQVTPSHVLHNVIDLGRYLTMLEALVLQLFDLGQFVVPVVLVLGLYAWLVRFKIDEPMRVTAATFVLALGLMLAGDLGVYILFSYDLNFQLINSLHRILLQLWPAAILTFFALAATPVLRAPPASKKAAPAKAAPAQTRKSKK